MDALLEGVLRTDGGCVRVEFRPLPDAAEHVVPSFPSGDAAWRDGALEWRGATYRDGDAIALGGGFVDEPDGYVPAQCADLEVFVVAP